VSEQYLVSGPFLLCLLASYHCLDFNGHFSDDLGQLVAQFLHIFRTQPLRMSVTGFVWAEHPSCHPALGFIAWKETTGCEEYFVFPSVLWHWWLGERKDIQAIKNQCHLPPKILLWNRLCTKTKQELANADWPGKRSLKRSYVGSDCKGITTETVVFVTQPLADVLMHVERGYRMESPEGCPREVYSIMKEAWDTNPAARPTFAAVSARLHSLRSPPTPTAGPTAF